MMLIYEILECSSWMKWPSLSASQSMLCMKIHLFLAVFKVNKHYRTSPADSSNLVQASAYSTCLQRGLGVNTLTYTSAIDLRGAWNPSV